MKSNLRKWKFWLSFSSLGLMLIMLGLPRLAHTSPPPALLAGPLTNGLLWLTLTNATNNEFYEIYRSPGLEPGILKWSLVATGLVNVTNFVVPTDPAVQGFFRALAGNNWDNDDALNYQDANPYDPTIGILTITIDSPTNGTTLH